ncbi:MAG: M48 family metallopeptidase [Nitrospina sp.]|mgnify:FL=1|nr:M48 family metallopeptidase [Nitrospina sp.]
MVGRKLQFAGALFDGKNSQKHFVNVELTPQEIILNRPGGDRDHWAFSDLSWSANTPFNIERLVKDEYGERLETLVVEDSDFYTSVLNIAPQNFAKQGKRLDFSWKLNGILILVLILFAYGLIKTIPELVADRMVEKIPVEWEVTVGQTLLDLLPIDQEPDPGVIAILQETVERLEKAVPGSQPYDLKVYILPIDQVNALALPGGAIVIFEGLLKKAESPEELAGVLAHEIQHILLRHSTRGILRHTAKGFLTAFFLGDVNAVMEGVVQLASELETLGLSREMEEEADQKGMDLILSANIDPRGMIRIFEKLTEEQSLQKELPDRKKIVEEEKQKFTSYFSTHPSGSNRVAQLKAQVQTDKNKTWTPLFPHLNWNKIKPEN